MPKSPLSKSRFNPGPGLSDFWSEFRRPNKYRFPILALSLVPVGLIMAWATSQEFYRAPERPRITYITTLEDGRTDAQIAAENAANQEIKDLRAAEEARLAKEKREIYKTLGKATGLDVEAIERKAEAERAAEEAAKKKRLEENARKLAVEGAKQ